MIIGECMNYHVVNYVTWGWTHLASANQLCSYLIRYKLGEFSPRCRHRQLIPGSPAQTVVIVGIVRHNR